MLYTTQQLQGGSRYNTRVLIGNWSEDYDSEETKFKDYLARRESGQLTVHQIERKLSKCLTPVDQSFSPDGLLRFGYKLMLLMEDIWDRITGQEPAYAVTSSPAIQIPVARSVFVLLRARENDGFEGDCLHFGQAFNLQVHPYLSPTPLYLHSCHTSPQSFARFSRLQEVCVHPRKSADVVWVVQHADPKLRFEFDGQLVPANQPVVIKHNQTGQFLAANFLNYKNDFGVEYEVCTHSYLNHKKTQQLSSEKTGKLTTDIPSRHQENQNIWMICTASDPRFENVTPPDADQQRRPEDILQEIRQSIGEKGAYGIRGLARVFKNLDNNGNRQLDLEEFKWGMTDYGIYLLDADLKTIFNYFDRNHNGSVNFDEFLVTIKGPVNQNRMRWVRAAYQKLDRNKDGQVTLDDIALIYDASQHIDVLNGKKTEDQVFREFITMWDTQEPDGIVTLEEFTKYYEDISASIDSDEYFEVMMRNAWKI